MSRFFARYARVLVRYLLVCLMVGKRPQSTLVEHNCLVNRDPIS